MEAANPIHIIYDNNVVPTPKHILYNAIFPDGSRSVQLNREFFVDKKVTTIKPYEVLHSIVIPFTEQVC